MRTENISMDVTMVATGIWQKVSLSVCKRTYNESCAVGWGLMIDTGGAISIIVDGWMIISCSSVELKRQEETSSV